MDETLTKAVEVLFSFTNITINVLEIFAVVTLDCKDVANSSRNLIFGHSRAYIRVCG